MVTKLACPHLLCGTFFALNLDFAGKVQNASAVLTSNWITSCYLDCLLLEACHRNLENISIHLLSEFFTCSKRYLLWCLLLHAEHLLRLYLSSEHLLLLVWNTVGKHVLLRGKLLWLLDLRSTRKLVNHFSEETLFLLWHLLLLLHHWRWHELLLHHHLGW
jgi:hypothetical protein